MRRIPSLHALRAFEAAARLESFLLASAELNLTASAISHQVRNLESHFGRALFARHNRQVALTDEGRRLLAQLTMAFDAIEAACGELQPTPKKFGLAVHCAPSFASKWLGPRLPSFFQQHPSINLRLTASADPIDLTLHDEIDLVIAYGKPSPGRGIVAESLGIEQISALATPALASQFDLKSATPQRHLPLIESTVSPVRWSDWFDLNGLQYSAAGVRPSFDRGALAVSAAVQGVGIALETECFAQDELARGELVRVGAGRLRSVAREMHFLCFRQTQRNVAKLTTFRDWLLAALAMAGRTTGSQSLADT
jgi:DNA-binding transcriptional LysR family regulator